MKITLSTTQAIHHLDREHFSYLGAKALIEYLEELEECESIEMELDSIGLASQYTEHESFTEAYKDRYQGEEITEEEAKNYFEAEAMVIPFDGGIIIDSNF